MLSLVSIPETPSAFPGTSFGSGCWSEQTWSPRKRARSGHWVQRVQMPTLHTRLYPSHPCVAFMNREDISRLLAERSLCFLSCLSFLSLRSCPLFSG